MAEWAWHAFELREPGERIGQVPITEWDHTDDLNDAGTWSATFAPPDPAAGDRAALIRQILRATDPARAVIVPFRDGLPLYGGIVWLRDRPTIAGSGLLSWFDRQYINTAWNFVAVDQHLIVRVLVDEAQAGPFTNWGIAVDTTDVTDSGVPRDQSWVIADAKNVGEAIRDKASLANGFDFDIRPELDGDNIIRRLRCWYPRRGRPVSITNLTFSHGGNVRNIVSFPEDASRTTNMAKWIGEETSLNVFVTGSAQALDALDRYPVLWHIEKRPDVKVAATLTEHAERYIADHGEPNADQIVLEVDPNDKTHPWGSWELGDDCNVAVPAGVYDWYPDGVAEVRRVVSHRWTVGPGGEHLYVATGKAITP